MTINSTPALGARLSKWLSFQVFLSFILVSLAVFVVISNYLESRQAEGLEERKIHVDHMFEETTGEDAAGELWHKLDDFLASHHELQLEIKGVNGEVIYLGENLNNILSTFCLYNPKYKPFMFVFLLRQASTSYLKKLTTSSNKILFWEVLVAIIGEVDIVCHLRQIP